jgi:hypothetical protein
VFRQFSQMLGSLLGRDIVTSGGARKGSIELILRLLHLRRRCPKQA